MDFGFSDFEERLLGADGPAVLRDAVERLNAVRKDLAKRHDEGLPVSDHQAALALLAAVNAAERILLDRSHIKGVN